MNLFKTKDYDQPERVKTVYGDGEKQLEENIIKSIKNLFKLKKNEAIKDIIIRDIRKLFEQEEKYYYKPIKVGNFLKTIIWSKKVVVIKNT